MKKTKNWLLNDGEYILNQHSDVPILSGTLKLKVINHHYEGDWSYWSNRIGKYPGVRKEVTTLLRRQKNKCTFCQATFKPIDLMEIEHIKPKSEGSENTYKNKQLLMIC